MGTRCCGRVPTQSKWALVAATRRGGSQQTPNSALLRAVSPSVRKGDAGRGRTRLALHIWLRNHLSRSLPTNYTPRTGHFGQTSRRVSTDLVDRGRAPTRSGRLWAQKRPTSHPGLMSGDPPRAATSRRRGLPGGGNRGGRRSAPQPRCRGRAPRRTDRPG